MYLLDNTTISDLLNGMYPRVQQRLEMSITQENELFVTPAVYFESMRGLVRTQSYRKIRALHTNILASIAIEQVREIDWMQAAEFHAFAKNHGYAFSDMDLLLAAVAYRLQATIVSSDRDFSPLPVIREDWRTPLTL